MNRFNKIMLFLPIILFVATEDFHFAHIQNVSAKELNFRMGEYNKLERLWYPRADLKTPSEYVNKVYKNGDVIVVGVVNSAFYIDKPFVNYITYKSKRFFNMSRNEGKEELWTGRPLIYNIKDFINLVPEDPNNSLWAIVVIRDFEGSSFEYADSLLEISEENKMVATLKYVGIDSRIGVYELRRKVDRV